MPFRHRRHHSPDAGDPASTSSMSAANRVLPPAQGPVLPPPYYVPPSPGGFAPGYSPYAHPSQSFSGVHWTPPPPLYGAPSHPPPVEGVPSPAAQQEEFMLAMAIRQSLAEQQQQQQQGAIRTSSSNERAQARDVSTRGQAEALSYRFWTTGSLSYTDLVMDGFYTPFDADFPEICSPDQFPKLDDLKKVTVAEDDPREVVCVDSKQDPILDQLKDRAREAMHGHGPHDSHDNRPKIQALARIVAEYFGGSFDSEDALKAVWQHTSASEKKFKGSVVIMLGRLRGGGAARHRALLFKMLADSQRIKCQLLTGRNLGQGVPDDTAMNQVVVNGRCCLVDLVHSPGALIPCDDLPSFGGSCPPGAQRPPSSGSSSAFSSAASNVPRHLSVAMSTNSNPSIQIQSPAGYGADAPGFQRPKAQSESNLQVSQPGGGVVASGGLTSAAANAVGGAGPANSWVSQLAVPDLIRLDSGPLVAEVDSSWAKFPPSSSTASSSASNLAGATAVSGPGSGGHQHQVGSSPLGGPQQQGGGYQHQPSAGGSHHGHSHSFDLGSLDFAAHQLQPPPNSQSFDPRHAGAGVPGGTARPPMHSPFASAAGGAASPSPPHHAPSDGAGLARMSLPEHSPATFGPPASHGAFQPLQGVNPPSSAAFGQPQHGYGHAQPPQLQQPTDAGALPHWVLNQFNNQIVSPSARLIQDLASTAASPFQRAAGAPYAQQPAASTGQRPGVSASVPATSGFTAMQQAMQQAHAYHQQLQQQQQRQQQQQAQQAAAPQCQRPQSQVQQGMGFQQQQQQQHQQGVGFQPQQQYQPQQQPAQQPMQPQPLSQQQANVKGTISSKSFAQESSNNSSQYFANLNPFNSVPILQKEPQRSLSQQQQQLQEAVQQAQQAQQQAAGAVPRRQTENSPASMESGRQWSNDGPATPPGPHHHGHSHSNGSVSSWEAQDGAQAGARSLSNGNAHQQQQHHGSPQPMRAAGTGPHAGGGAGQEASTRPGQPVQPAGGPVRSAFCPPTLQLQPQAPPAKKGSPFEASLHAAAAAPSAWPPQLPGLQDSSEVAEGPEGWPPQPQQQRQLSPSGFPPSTSAVHGQVAPFHPGLGPRLGDIVSRMPSLQLGQSKDWEIDPEELKYGERIGHGSYGEVYKGEWRRTEVAIKKFLEQTLSKTTVKEFKTEVSIMHTLKHPNVVLFMGAVVKPDQLAIVTQFIPRGALFGLLHQCPVCHPVELPPKRRLAFARDIAKGMYYLHSCAPPVVHRDLKSANLLVDRDWTIKVCDFGLSQVKRAAYLTAKTEMGGTAEWMAPEVLRNEATTEKCDLYSYGVILYELVTGEKPWSHLHNRAQVIGLVGYNHQHLPVPDDLQPEVAQLMLDCWAEAPEERPTFAEVLDRLGQLKDTGLVPSPSRLAASREENASNCAHH